MIGSPEDRARREAEEARSTAPPPVVAASATAPAAPASAAVSAAGVTLRSVSLTLPTSDRAYPDGPHADAINNNCLACHSAGMVLTQPTLSRAAWQDEVDKMVTTYKAPVAAADITQIVDYLTALKPSR